jgi:hypothetical protein
MKRSNLFFVLALLVTALYALPSLASAPENAPEVTTFYGDPVNCGPCVERYMRNPPYNQQAFGVVPRIMPESSEEPVQANPPSSKKTRQ